MRQTVNIQPIPRFNRGIGEQTVQQCETIASTPKRAGRAARLERNRFILNRLTLQLFDGA
jgi:hypothetical protein